jgi:pyruvate ferredoxin oxidoreductase gamma subunit
MLLEFLILGRGGQGVVTAGRVLAEAALRSGLFSQSFPEFGPERSGAPVRAYVRISKHLVALRSPVESVDGAVVFEERLLGTGVASFVKRGGVLVVNTPSPLHLDIEGVSVFSVDASRAVAELGRPRSLNLAMLGAFSRVSGAVPLEAVERVVAERFGERDAAVVRLGASMVVVEHAA